MADKTQFDKIPHKDYENDPIGQFYTLSEIFYKNTVGPMLKKDLKEALDERDSVIFDKCRKIECDMIFTRAIAAVLFLLMFLLTSC